MTEENNIQNTNKLAFVLDGVCELVFNTDSKFAAILLSSPLILDVSDNNSVFSGWLYNEETNTFSHPNPPDTDQLPPVPPLED
jgi:hypothetical protein